jgi:hypothetical protein
MFFFTWNDKASNQYFGIFIQLKNIFKTITKNDILFTSASHIASKVAMDTLNLPSGEQGHKFRDSLIGLHVDRSTKPF